MGTQEFYSAVDDLGAVSDSLVVHLEDSEGELGELLMFVSIAPGNAFDSRLRDTIRETLRSRMSPRYVPDMIIEVPAIPLTITGKRLEVPVKRILKGMPLGPEIAASLVDRDMLEPFIALAATRRATAE